MIKKELEIKKEKIVKEVNLSPSFGQKVAVL